MSRLQNSSKLSASPKRHGGQAGAKVVFKIKSAKPYSCEIRNLKAGHFTFPPSFAARPAGSIRNVS
jgi:hypothetical protein